MSKPSLVSRYFAFTERRLAGDRLVFNLLVALVIGSLVMVILHFNAKYLVLTPTRGGTLVEGVVGTPRFVNPVLAITPADLDMSALVYSGLMKIDANGDLVPDLAENVTLDSDGTTYHIKLRQDRFFSNGMPVTADDVVYTIGLIQNADLKSPLHANWDGVTITKVDDHNLTLTLKEPYAAFKENLTLGILPHGLWGDLPTEQLPFSQHNTEPIGSGEYMVSKVERNESGLINSYTLIPSPTAAIQPNIKTVVVRFYSNEDDVLSALKKGDVSATASLSPQNLSTLAGSKFTEHEITLPRTFAVFFNENKVAALRDQAVRNALATMVDRQTLINDVLGGHGIPTDTPIPPGFSTIESTSTPTSTSETDRLTAAKAILTAADWTQGSDGSWSKKTKDGSTTLAVTLSTANSPLFDSTATKIAGWWTDLGVKVNVEQYNQNDLVQSVIRPRDFEVLLFGNEVGRALDLYPFWHSSQKDDPGLNITGYANIDTDSLLTKMRVATSSTETAKDLSKFTKILTTEKPAVFLFAPTFTYVTDPHVMVTTFTRLGSPSDRFDDIAHWYMNDERLWPIFTHTK